MIERLSLACLLCCVVVVFGQYPATSGRCQTTAKLIVSGSCILLTNCPSLMTLLQTATEANIATLRQSHCGFEGYNPKVCCPDTTDTSNLIPKSGDDGSLLPSRNVCGLNTFPTFLGGLGTTLSQYPWTALLEFSLPGGHGFRCEGSLINNRYILTAAHCIKSAPSTWKLISVRLGEHNLETEEDCDESFIVMTCSDPPLDVEVEEVTVHEEFSENDFSYNNDIALLRLKEEVQFTEYIQPICLPTAEMNNNQFEGEVKYLEVTGWGINADNGKSSEKLHYSVPVVPNNECSVTYSANVNLTDNQLCAGGREEKDTCIADSGGSLMFSDSFATDNNWYAVGVLSFGPKPCGTTGRPNVYTRVTNYVDWIIKHMH